VPAAYVPEAQGSHLLAPKAETEPVPHLVVTLEPLHSLPTGQRSHSVRMELLPPWVKKSIGHSWQACGVPSRHEKKLSLPHGEHCDLPSLENVPLGQAVIVLPPSHFDPAGQTSHVSRVFWSPPEV
jgi:hypothetical protein